MIVTIYGGNGPMLDALVAAFRANDDEVNDHVPRFWQGQKERCDLQIVHGIRRPGMLDRKDIPVIVYEWGYLRRVNNPDELDTGHWQLGLGGLNRVPSFPCHPDRFDKLGLEVRERGGDPNGYVLLIGQVPCDSAHAHIDLKSWLMSKAKMYGNAVYRPHPRGALALPDVPLCEAGSLEEALAGARLVVTYNSNTGHDALLAGVPVICAPCAAYAELSGEALPSKAAREAYFHRVAYGQWTADEVRSGAFLPFLMNHLIPNIPMVVPEVVTT